MSKNIKIILTSLLVVFLLSGVSFSYVAAQDTDPQLPGTEDDGGGFDTGDPTGGPTDATPSDTSIGDLPETPGGITTEPMQIIQNVLNWVMSTVGAFAVLFIVIGGFRYITSANNPELVEGAKKTIRFAVIGLLIAVLALVLVNTIGNALLFGGAT
ncbi:Mbov_0395 family pilin-like conjugal transfer protein [Patescibacteria group bacterium]